MKRRTTLTLDDDVAARLDDEAHRQRKPFRDVVNEALRRGLAGGARVRKLPPYRVKVHQSGLMPGVDPLGFNRLADELENETFRRKPGRRRK